MGRKLVRIIEYKKIFVGGKVKREGDALDILERTLEREIFEEVKIKVKILGYVKSSSFVTDKDEKEH